MDVHLIIVDFTKHQKGYSVQRCEAAVRTSLTREFGPGIPFVFYAPAWVAQFLSTPHEVQTTPVEDVVRFVKDRIAGEGRERPNAKIIVASYSRYVRLAAQEAGTLNGVVVGTLGVADYAHGFYQQRPEIEWSGVPVQSAPSAPVFTNDRRGAVPQPPPVEYRQAPPAPPAIDHVNTAAAKPPEPIPEPAATAIESGPKEPEKYPRSRNMRASVQRVKLFNEKPIRDLLFKTVKQIVPRERLQLSALRRTLAEESFAASGYSDKQKWDGQVYFFCRLLVFSGALLGPSEPLSHGAAADGTEVRDISPTLEDDAEAYLIEHIIRDLGNVTEFEHCPLAHAVLRQFDTAADMGTLKDRVAYLISKISDRVTLDESGTYIHRASKPALRAVK